MSKIRTNIYLTSGQQRLLEGGASHMDIMDTVFLLWHIREVKGRANVQLFMGVYTTGQQAKAAIERLKGKPGFVDYPKGFQIHPHELNRDVWTEGFVLTED